MKSYVYRNTINATQSPEGWIGEDVFWVKAESILEADREFNASGLVFGVNAKGKTILIPASKGVENLSFISCRWTS